MRDKGRKSAKQMNGCDPLRMRRVRLQGLQNRLMQDRNKNYWFELSVLPVQQKIHYHE